MGLCFLKKINSLYKKEVEDYLLDKLINNHSTHKLQSPILSDFKISTLPRHQSR